MDRLRMDTAEWKRRPRCLRVLRCLTERCLGKKKNILWIQTGTESLERMLLMILLPCWRVWRARRGPRNLQGRVENAVEAPKTILIEDGVGKINIDRGHGLWKTEGEERVDMMTKMNLVVRGMATKVADADEMKTISLEGLQLLRSMMSPYFSKSTMGMLQA